jgi:E3 ubiquitin-protein ligase BRE1
LSGEKLPPPGQHGECLYGHITTLDQPNLTLSLAEPGISIPATLYFEDSQTLRKHLSGRKDKIIAALSGLFAKFPSTSPEVTSLQQQMSKLLATEKEHICELQRVMTEKEQTSERLVTATHRYMIAEKKIDRLKSQQVQKLESQAMASSAPVKEETPSGSNGAEPVNGVALGAHTEEVETARDQALAEAAKRKEHVEQLEAENKKLTEEVTALNVKLAGLSDDDYAKTELFKAIKSQHEDVIKRINNLEATNIQLREEAQKFQAERTAYRIRVDDEARATVSESEGNMVQAETNLTRIRNARDELLAKNNLLEVSRKDVELSQQQTKELVAACESRIASLESECERLRLQVTEQESTEGTADLESLSPEQLRSKVKTLEKQSQLLSNEMPAMEAAYRKAQAVAGKKLSEIATWEEHISRATADKVKADQKFFAAMKAKELLQSQLKALREQASKGAEVVAQLKETESLNRSSVEKLEKQTAEMKAQMEDLAVQHRQLQHKTNENAIVTEGHVSQIAELKKVVETKDATCITAKKAQREAEVERDKMAAQIDGLDKQVDHWKQKSQGKQSDSVAIMEVSLSWSFQGDVTLTIRRACFNARSARTRLRILLSRLAGTFSATNASKTALPTAQGNAPAAAKRSAITIPCEFTFNHDPDTIVRQTHSRS